ncbi:MAG: ParB N-terminal domain-containing protein [Deltaproteobacteria bacterium]|nr:ParB N-terminal domain-containing protein [Deltaproteobacteria bacterium]
MNSLISTFKKALKRLHGDDEVKNFEKIREKQEPFEPLKRGIHPVEVDRIVGSVGRYQDFDSRFRPKDHLPKDRLAAIKRTMKEGGTLPPVKLYQIKDEYYVLDGNHRIAAAKALGLKSVDAQIVELIPSRNTLENVLARERIEFQEKTGLSHPIALTEIGQYAYLIKQIRDHHRFLEKAGTTSVSLQEAAADWHKSIYGPLHALIEKAGIIHFFSRRTIDDLYTYISYHQWEKGQARKYGIGIDRLIPRDMEEFREKMANMKEAGYPEMKREITAFILMRVKPKNEFDVMERLFALDEVQEVHSVHGDVDMLVKIVLTRDLLASDAEIIGQFVHDTVIQLPDVVSTQTLIPGASRIKEGRR